MQTLTSCKADDPESIFQHPFSIYSSTPSLDFGKAGIILTGKEKEDIEVVDFGLNELESTGLELITYMNTDRCCAKELNLNMLL